MRNRCPFHQLAKLLSMKNFTDTQIPMLQWWLDVSLRLAPGAAAQLSCPLIQPALLLSPSLWILPAIILGTLYCAFVTLPLEFLVYCTCHISIVPDTQVHFHTCCQASEELVTVHTRWYQRAVESFPEWNLEKDQTLWVTLAAVQRC